MKRSTIAGLVLGVLVSAVVIALHATGMTRPLEQGLMDLVTHGQEPGAIVGSKMQYFLVLLLSLGAAWLVSTSVRRKSVGIVLAVLAVELLVVSWVCMLYNVFFQPLPSILAVALGIGAANGFIAFGRRNRSGVTHDLFHGRLAQEQVRRLTSGELPFKVEAKSYEVTAVVCDIANKHDLADECPPELLATITDKFIRSATDSFLTAGAYIETVTGEGIVALFGFPVADDNQAEKATRHALSLLESFEKMRESGRDEDFTKFGVNLGISSGTMLLAPLHREGGSTMLATGEPVELARRFCIANRFYGSRILIGPRTFELASKAIVARPIDFLSGVDVRERHEIYEPLLLTTEATAEQIGRRDSFWNGVVLYREKRWAEAYSQFQKARGPNEFDDAPLHLYLRRIEPLALHLMESP